MTRCLLQHSINDLSDCRKRHSIIFYMAEIMDSVFRTDGDEIMTTIIFMPWGTCRRNTIFVHKQFVRCHECRFFSSVETRHAESPNVAIVFFSSVETRHAASPYIVIAFLSLRRRGMPRLYRWVVLTLPSTETRHAASLQMGCFDSAFHGDAARCVSTEWVIYRRASTIIYSCSSRIPENPLCCGPGGWGCRGRRGSAARSGCSAGSRRFSSSRGTTPR